MARPTTYNLEICKKICDEVREGGSIKQILKKKRSYPSFGTWCNWKRDNLELLNLYIGAMQDKAETALEKIEDYQQQLIDGEITKAQAHILINTEKWKAAKFYPKMFGTNASLDITSGGKEITQQLTVFELPNNNREQNEPTPENGDKQD